MKDLSYLFQQERFADVDFVIWQGSRAGPSVDTAEPDRFELTRFPAHLNILCRIEYFDKQVLFQAAACSAQDSTSSRPTLNITVDDASHVPAVEAIIAVIYGVEGSLTKLQQHQLVYVVQYADMMRFDLVVKEAVRLLLRAAKAAAGLSEDTLNVLYQPTWPDCLLPLLPALAESVGSNLETVWESEQLSSKLLKLPLAAMRLLLSSDKLQVYSEDTVMYTAARYVTAQPEEQQEEASKQLSQLVRAPHLSDFQLTAQAANEDQTAFNILRSHQPLLRKLLTLERHGPATASDVARLLPTAQKSWQLPARQILPPTADGVKLLWPLPVSDLNAAYNECRGQKHLVNLFSKSVSAPISGTAWKLQLQCSWDEAVAGVKVGVFSTPAWCPSGVICKHDFEIEGHGVHRRVTSHAFSTSHGWGFADYFGCGVGPFGKSAWVDKALPTTGNIDLKLTVIRFYDFAKGVVTITRH